MMRTTDAPSNRLLAGDSKEIALLIRPDGRILETNDSAELAYGYTTSEFRTLSFIELEAKETGLTGVATFHRRKDGSIFPAEVSSLGIEVAGEPAVLCLVRAAAGHVCAGTPGELVTVALQSAANAAMITDRTGQIIWVNGAFERLTGYSAAEVIGRSPLMLGGSTSAYEQMRTAVLAGQTCSGETESYCKDGTPYTEEETVTPVCNPEGAVTHLIHIKRDVTARKHREEKLLYLAMHDPLTGLPNRRAWEESLAGALHRARAGSQGAILLLDLDHFKYVNDTMGHPVGDQLLKDLARCMGRALRRGDLLARLGGDEFGILMEDVSMHRARAVAERLRQAVSAFRVRGGGGHFEPTISIGLVPVDAASDLEGLMQWVDTALYAAKERGKNRIALLSRRGPRSGVPRPQLCEDPSGQAVLSHA